MRLRDFLCLSDAGKNEAVSLKGDFINDKIIYGYRVVLYKIDDFFVEVYHDIVNEEVRKLKGCVRSDLLV